MWQAVTEAVGPEAATACGRTPTCCPPSADLDDPSALVARLTAAANGEEPEHDAVDQALEDLLRGDTERPTEE